MKPSPPNRPTPSLRWNAMPTLTPLAAARKESFCAISSPPSSARWIGDDLSRIRRAERDFLFLAALVVEDRHEQRFAGEQTLSGAHQRAEHPGLLRRAVAEDGFHLDAVFHVHHAAGLGDGRFVRIELDFDELHVVAENLVVDLMHRCHLGSFRVDRADGDLHLIAGPGGSGHGTQRGGSCGPANVPS